MNWMRVLVVVGIVATLVIDDVASLSLDPAASAELEQHIRQGDCIISMRHIRPRRKLHISIEALFMIDFPMLKHKLSFFLDRKQQRVTLDISDNGSIESKNFNIPFTNETTTIRSLAIHFHKNRISVLVDCKQVATEDIDIGLNKLYTQMDDPIIKLFRERKYPLHFDGSVEAALQRVNCERGLHRHGNRRMLRNKTSEREKNKKRDVRNWYNQQAPNANDRQLTVPMDGETRGDIPVMHGDCEDAIAKTLADLLALIKLLREDVAQQRQEIAYLRMLLETCAGCKDPNASASLRAEPTCRNSNPCYPGVECQETLSAGLRCGPCPSGMLGDGKICKQAVTCNDRPCYAGVPCHDTLNGAQCGPCPIGYDGDGRTCAPRSPCPDGPCASGNVLLPSHNVQHYQRQYTSRKYSVITS